MSISNHDNTQYMYIHMGNCSGCMTSSDPKIDITIAILGLNGSGKTTVLKALKGESIDDVIPTVGFRSDNLSWETANVTVYDLGGGPKIRDIWRNYMPEVWGIIYVVDASNKQQLEETQAVFERLLSNTQIQQKPVLLLLNKQDVPGAIDEVDALEHLHLKRVVNSNKCPCRVEICTASKGTGKNIDKAIIGGVSWLIEQMHTNHDRIKDKVEEDMANAKEELRKEREKRSERLRLAKLEEENEGKVEVEAEQRINGDRQQNVMPSRVSNGFEPLPGIEEESASQASVPYSTRASLKIRVSSLDQDSLNESNNGRKNSLKEGDPILTPLGSTNSIKLPPIMVISNAKPSPNSESSAIIRSTNSRKRRKRRLMKMNKTSPSSDSERSENSVHLDTIRSSTIAINNAVV